MPLLSCAERRNLYALLTERRPCLWPRAVQHLAHMPPKRRRRIRDLRGKLLVGAGDVLPTAALHFIDGNTSIWQPPAPDEEERTIGWAACSC